MRSPTCFCLTSEEMSQVAFRSCKVSLLLSVGDGSTWEGRRPLVIRLCTAFIFSQDSVTRSQH